MKLLRLIIPAALLLLLSACDGEPPLRFGPQQWHGIGFVVETRPSPPRPGMNEFLIIATNPNGTQAYRLIVSVRTDPNEPWRQAIQDGYVGVFRKALPVKDPATDVLYVQVQYKPDQSVGELAFPLRQQAPRE